jgi:hypothetical protein
MDETWGKKYGRTPGPDCQSKVSTRIFYNIRNHNFATSKKDFCNCISTTFSRNVAHQLHSRISLMAIFSAVPSFYRNAAPQLIAKVRTCGTAACGTSLPLRPEVKLSDQESNMGFSGISRSSIPLDSAHKKITWNSVRVAAVRNSNF